LWWNHDLNRHDWIEKKLNEIQWFILRYLKINNQQILKIQTLTLEQKRDIFERIRAIK
jgi:hypothetical protein